MGMGMGTEVKMEVGWVDEQGRILKGATYASFDSDSDAVRFLAFCLCNNKFYI